MKLSSLFSKASANTVTTHQKQVRYGGFHARMCATIIDMFLSAVLLMPLVQLLSPLMYGDNTPRQLMQQVAADSVARMAAEQRPSILHFVQSLFHDARVYQYFMIDGGLWRMGVEQLLQLLVVMVMYLYFWVYVSATPGKMAMALKIVDAKTLEAPSRKQLYIRFLGYLLSTLPLGLGFLWIAFDKRKQGWHDKLAHTLVIKR